jgi:Trk-type K+ transport system membrane component
MAVSLISVLVILYFIGFLLLGILTIGLWSKFVRPDIPREDGVTPFWAGAFLATSAFCNNGMSLIDTNMGPYQKEYVVCSVQKNMILLTLSE